MNNKKVPTVAVRITNEGWEVVGAGWDGVYLMDNDAFFDYVAERYGVTGNAEAALLVDVLVSPTPDYKRVRGWSNGYKSIPSLVLRPTDEDLVDIDGKLISAGQNYAINTANEEYLCTVALCWEGIIRAFATDNPGELYVYFPWAAALTDWDCDKEGCEFHD